jgi:hypothetical protein
MIVLRDNSSSDSLLPNGKGHALKIYPTSGSRRSEEDGEGIKLEEDEDMASWAGQPSIKGSTESMRMALLTLSLVGLQ